jgi:hypothetical protein
MGLGAKVHVLLVDSCFIGVYFLQVVVHLFKVARSSAKSKKIQMSLGWGKWWWVSWLCSRLWLQLSSMMDGICVLQKQL